MNEINELMTMLNELDDTISCRIAAIEGAFPVRVPLEIQVSREPDEYLRWDKHKRGRHNRTWRFLLGDHEGYSLLHDTDRGTRCVTLRHGIPQLLELSPRLLEEAINERKQALLAGSSALELVGKIVEKTQGDER